MSSTKKKPLKINAAILKDAAFKANPNYDLVLFDRLSPAEQEMLADLQKDSNFYGILRPVESSDLSIKSVSQDTALLYLTLREASRLPAYAQTKAAENYEAIIGKLVLDQILEIENDGEFVSGAQAYDLLYGGPVAAEARSRIGQLSIAALQYGQELAISGIMELSMRLYNYQRIPVSQRWQQKFPTPEKVAEHLGIHHQETLNAHWQPTPKSRSTASAQTAQAATESETSSRDASSDPLPTDLSSKAHDNSAGWLSWNSRRARLTARQDGTIFKLYISPRPEIIREAFDITSRTLATTAAFHFKVGADLEGMLRPDKMVAYFASLEDLQTAAHLLAYKLEGCPAQGVPFTAEIAGDGLLSWGVDPPESQQLLKWQPRESWRLWLTNRLANALLNAKNGRRADGANSLEPWQYALQRLTLEGVDTDLWTPTPQIWQ